jgi:hypothetical protein
MFVRFRESGYRLQASLIETRRVGGKVRHEHIASLGSIVMPQTVGDRIAFWNRLHERLAKLSNRVDAETQGKILGAIHAKVPMVTADEQRALQLANAQADLKFWESLGGMHASTVEGHKGMIACAEQKVAESEAERATAAEKVARAKDRIARIERGDDVAGGLGKPMTYEDCEAILLDAGMTKRDIKDAQLFASLPEEILPEIVKVEVEASQRAGRAATRRAVRAALIKQANDDAAG